MKEQFLAALNFVPYAALTGAAVSMLDFLSSLVSGKSVLGLHYGGGGVRTARWLALWTVGAAVGGFVGLLTEILQGTVAAAITVAITWPLLLRRIAQKLQEEEPQQQDVGIDADEEE